MKIIITILLSACTWSAVGQTKIYIVGTVHNRTRNFNSDSVLIILERLKPDLILMELDSSFFDKNFNIKIKLYTNETLGIKKYVSKHPTSVRPYDIKPRDIAISTVKIEAESLDRLNSIAWKLEPSQRQTYLDLKNSNKELIYFVNKRPYEINQKGTDSLVERSRILMYHGLLEVIESRKELDDLQMGYRQGGEFWDWRNKRMAQNVFTFLNMDIFKNKTIVLFAGFFHRYYLLNELTPKQKMVGFVIKEYYE